MEQLCLYCMSGLIDTIELEYQRSFASREQCSIRLQRIFRRISPPGTCPIEWKRKHCFGVTMEKVNLETIFIGRLWVCDGNRCDILSRRNSFHFLSDSNKRVVIHLNSFYFLPLSPSHTRAPLYLAWRKPIPTNERENILSPSRST